MSNNKSLVHDKSVSLQKQINIIIEEYILHLQ